MHFIYQCEINDWAHPLYCTGHWRIQQELIKLRRIFTINDGVSTGEWRFILLNRCCSNSCCSCCEHPLCIPAPPIPPRRDGNGFFQANLSLSQRWWRQPKCESGGGWKASSLPAIAVRRLLLLWSHTGKSFPFSFCNYFPITPCGTLVLWRWMAFLLYQWVRYCTNVFVGIRRSRLDAGPPADSSEQ